MTKRIMVTTILNRWVKWFLPFYLFTFLPINAQVGTWRNYLAYHDVQQIQAVGNDLFVLASNGLYQYNKNDQSITTYDKVNGLSDVTITHIKWCPEAKRLVVAYDNSNIDLVETNGNVTNVSDVYLKAFTGDKTINSITINGPYAYLACGFGVVKLNAKKAEIKESYILGFSVSAITLDNSNIYVQSPSGVYTASLSSNLIDKSNWAPATESPSFEQDNSDYDQNIELVSTLQPGGPKYNYFGYMKFENSMLYTCQGSTTGKPCIQILKNQEWDIYQDEGITEQTGRAFPNVYCIDYDPQDFSHVFAGSSNGMYEFKDGRFVNFYNSANSLIEAYNGRSMNTQLVTGLKFDKEGSLWILNSSAPTTSMIKYANGTFTKLNHSELMKLNTNSSLPNRSNGNLCNMMIDSEGLMWFCNDNWTLPAFYQYDMANDAIKAYETFTNQDGLTTTLQGGVRCVVEDLNHDLWIGTSGGLFLLERSHINDENPVMNQVKVPRNDGTNYADYLLAGASITSIAIDGAGRKWIGTSTDGVYLISADNMEQIQHFTPENSKLLSSGIQSIAINQSTGEVFFGTSKGLCSYMSDATEINTDMNADNVWAYPNPVNPDYTGPITITGLTFNADVKILSANGVLIAQGRSNGGTFVWDGCDTKGRRVASGVYMVATATSDGQKGTVCKIAVVR